MSTIPFLNLRLGRSGIKSKLAAYLVCGANTDQKFHVIEWLKCHTANQPKWCAVARKIVLIRPSSAASEGYLVHLNIRLCPEK